MNNKFLKVREGARFWWHRLGLPGLALLIWTLGTGAYEWNLIDRHATQPGPYRTPAKYAERKRAKIIALTGYIALVFLLALHLYRRKAEQEAQEATMQTPNTEC